MKQKLIPLEKTTLALVITSLALLLLSVSGCYKDKAETLYPQLTCDTTGVTYSASIAPMLSAYCNSCHGGNTPSGNLKFDYYQGVKYQVDNGHLIGAVTHAPGYQPMPKDQNMLSNCNIAKIRSWIAAGAPNN